jgi:hypothetical protein
MDSPVSWYQKLSCYVEKPFPWIPLTIAVVIVLAVVAVTVTFLL